MMLFCLQVLLPYPTVYWDGLPSHDALGRPGAPPGQAAVAEAWGHGHAPAASKVTMFPNVDKGPSMLMPPVMSHP